jgi:hypothetical protein
MLEISDSLQIKFCVGGEVRKFDEVCWLAHSFARNREKVAILHAE